MRVTRITAGFFPEIKRQIPNALVVHIIRDGRDVALSYVKQGSAYPFPWDRKEPQYVLCP